MRLLICGGRNYADFPTIKEKIIELDPDVVIHGAARGADTLADRAAHELGLEVVTYPAQWNKFGKRAGFVRNAQMLREGRPDIVLAFPGGVGTQMMVDLAKQAKVEVIEVK